MTDNFARKRAARQYAATHGVSYRVAVQAIRRAGGTSRAFNDHARRLLIEAVEGCGVSHWSRVEAWDGAAVATIVDLGGERFTLTVDAVATALAHHVGRPSSWIVSDDPMGIDSYVADEVIQTMLFGGVIYRPGIRRRVVA